MTDEENVICPRCGNKMHEKTTIVKDGVTYYAYECKVDGCDFHDPNRIPYTLTDCVETNKEYPDTFSIPSDVDVAKLEAGDFVKLIFTEDHGRTERMWVKITQVDGLQYTGILDNHPLYIPIELGDEVKFDFRHIADFKKVD